MGLATIGVEVTPLVFYTNHGPIQFDVWDCAGQEKFGGLRDGYLSVLLPGSFKIGTYFLILLFNFCSSIGGQAAIFMFDVTSRFTYKNIPNWYRDVSRVCGVSSLIAEPAKPATAGAVPSDVSSPEPQSPTKADAGAENNVEKDSSSSASGGVKLSPSRVAKYSPGIPVVICGNKVDVVDRKVLPKSITFHRSKNVQYYDISAKSNYNFEKPFLYLGRRFFGCACIRCIETPVS